MSSCMHLHRDIIIICLINSFLIIYLFINFLNMCEKNLKCHINETEEIMNLMK